MSIVGQQIGAAIRERRTRAGMSQAELAETLREVGLTLHSTAICRIENGSRDLRLTEASVIAAALGTNTAALLGEMSTSAAEAYQEGYRAALNNAADRLHQEAQSIAAPNPKENRNV